MFSLSPWKLDTNGKVIKSLNLLGIGASPPKIYAYKMIVQCEMQMLNQTKYWISFIDEICRTYFKTS